MSSGLTRLTGMDIAETAIARCRARLGRIATSSVGSVGDVQGHHDVMYTSGVLEHFRGCREAARRLAKCDRLCVMVPLEQLGEDRRPLSPVAHGAAEAGEGH